MNRLSSALRAPLALLASIALALGLLTAGVLVAGTAQAASSTPRISTDLPDGQVNKTHLSGASVSGGKSPYRCVPYTYTSKDGYNSYVLAAPPGLNLNGKGQLAGRPTKAGCYFVYVEVYDARGNSDYSGDYFTIFNRDGSAPACART